MGNCPERLMSLTRGGTTAVVIANATDAYPHERRSEGVSREMDALSALGFQAEELDLRAYFDGGMVDDDLRGRDLVWIRGGDVFTLRYSLARSGADHVLHRLLTDDEVVYGGYSAGICVLAPTLRGLEQVDDPTWLRMLYDADPPWDGLGVLDYSIVPHVDSPEHPESPACDRLAELYRTSGIAHRTLRDGDVLVVDGEAEETRTV